MTFGKFTTALLSVVFTRVHSAANVDTDRDRGFGKNYVWANSLTSGIKLASNHEKPVMLIVHKSWCSACKRLKPKFADSAEIQRLSQNFIMVNVEDDEEPKNVEFAPDGQYIPRIIFLTPNGKVDRSIINEDGHSQYKYFYSRPEHIVRSMKKAAFKYSGEKIIT